MAVTPRGWGCPYKEGTATILSGATSVTVTHNKGVTNYPQVTPLQDMGALRYWTPEADITATAFKIEIDSTSSDKKFKYRV
jgi:hypothetical protein